MRLDYLARETGQNLIRNWLLSIATVLIVTVSLTMFGITVLLGFYGLDNAFIRWNNDVSFIVYMNAARRRTRSTPWDLDKSPQSTRQYYDDDKTYELYQRIFQQESPRDRGAQQGELPMSFRVKPSNPRRPVVRSSNAIARPACTTSTSPTSRSVRCRAPRRRSACGC